MSLDIYRRKRDFAKTKEPPPGRAGRRKGSSFCVQKHDATRLHYDFRLELDGVLKSWAVTKGPSLDPSDKRLAVRTEDHPLSYGDFEGTIPKGQYGGGTVMLWDRGTWTPEGDPRAGLEKGHLTFTLDGERLRGKWALIRMRGKEKEKRENWLLVKENDDESRKGKAAEKFLESENTSIKTGRGMEGIAASKPSKKQAAGKRSARSRAPKTGRAKGKKAAAKVAQEPLSDLYGGVQLATLVTDPPQGKEWLHEVKYDGYRILCFVEQGAATIRTRNGHDWTTRFPAVAEALRALEVENAVLDGEAVLLDEKGISHFQTLQEALGQGGDMTRIEAYFFDLLHLDGESLVEQPLTARKKALRELLRGAKRPLYYSGHLEGGKTILARACRMGLEGLVSKRKNAPYAPGRGKSWLKSKCNKRQEFIIIGYTDSKSGGRAIGALHLGYMSEGEMAYAGKVGTGFGAAAAQDIFDRLQPLRTDAKPAVKGLPPRAGAGTAWVRPRLLCEASFTEWTRSGHIRHPSFEGLREDKKAADIVRDEPVKAKEAMKENPKKKKDAGPVTVSGVTITHPAREIFSGTGITKQDLAEYYAAVAPYMLKDISGKPISLLRCPGGADAECFFQRDPDEYFKKWTKPFSWKHKGKTHEYLYITTEKSLVFLAQMGVIEIHPWGAQAGSIDKPRRIVFDLDPDDGVPFEAVKLAARDIRGRLERRGLESFLKCTGGKGLHVVAPLTGRQAWPEVKAFAKALATEMAHDVPKAYVATMSKQKRRGKIFIDYFRNDYTATAIADYSVRAREGGPVAVPLAWEELPRLKSANGFKMKDVLRRLEKKGDDLRRYAVRQSLPKI